MPLDLNLTNPHKSGGHARKRLPSTTAAASGRWLQICWKQPRSTNKNAEFISTRRSCGVLARLSVVGSQHGLAPGRQEIPHLADLREPPNERSIHPPLQRLLAQNFQRFLRGKGFSVRAVVDQRIINIRHLQDARL